MNKRGDKASRAGRLDSVLRADTPERAKAGRLPPTSHLLSALGSPLLLALALDLLFGEPPNAWHPVVWIGAAITALERHAPRAGRRSCLAGGAVATLGLAAVTGAGARAFERSARRLPPIAGAAVVAALLKPAFSLRMLLGAGSSVRAALEAGDLVQARAQLRSLVSRDATALSEQECAAAAIESLAENLADSVIGPWLGYALAGLPGAWLFRCVNTLDSRWGYHGRYEFLGRFAARADDMLVWVPARLSAILLIVAAPAGGGDIALAWRVMCRDHGLTESPNAGWTMSAMAGALGSALAKRGHYVLNACGEDCSPNDIRRAGRIVLAAGLLGLPITKGFGYVLRCLARRLV